MNNTDDHTSLNSQVTVACACAKSLDNLLSAGFRSKQRAGSICELHSRGFSASTWHAGGGKPSKERRRLGFKQPEAFTCSANVPTQLNNCPMCKLALLIFVDVMTGSLGSRNTRAWRATARLLHNAHRNCAASHTSIRLLNGGAYREQGHAP